jgi:hypothetical protein
MRYLDLPGIDAELWISLEWRLKLAVYPRRIWMSDCGTPRPREIVEGLREGEEVELLLHGESAQRAVSIVPKLPDYVSMMTDATVVVE